MRRRLPGRLGRFGGNVAVIANRVMRGLSHPRPPERTDGGKRFGGRVARLILDFGQGEVSVPELGRDLRSGKNNIYKGVASADLLEV
ncbi:MAG: hypothetical protein WCO57_16095, partial [Verrucomicrobiota bacterium]